MNVDVCFNFTDLVWAFGSVSGCLLIVLLKYSVCVLDVYNGCWMSIMCGIRHTRCSIGSLGPCCFHASTDDQHDLHSDRSSAGLLTESHRVSAARQDEQFNPLYCRNSEGKSHLAMIAE